MESKQLFRMSGAMIVTGAVLISVGYWLRPGMEDLVQVYTAPMQPWSFVLSLAGALCLAIGFPGLYAYQAARAGKFGLIAFLLMFFGFELLEIGTAFFYGMIAPVLASHPDGIPFVIAGGLIEQSTAIGYYFLPALLATNLGFILMAVSLIRARVFPRPAGWVMLAAIPVLFLAPMDGPGMTLLAAGLALCGLEMARNGGAHVSLQAAAAAM